MANTLSKSLDYAYAGTSGTPGTIGTKAYTSYETQTVCDWVLEKSKSKIKAGDADIGTVTSESYVYKCTETQVAIYHPSTKGTSGTPGTPMNTEKFYNLGWNSGARSNAFISTDGFAQFTALAGVSGVIAGFNDTDADAGYLNINYAFYLTHGIAKIYESGVEKYYIGAYTSGSTFRIDRKFGVVRYYVNDVLKYASATPSVGTVFLDASLYSGGDAIDSPTVEGYNLGAAAVSFRRMQALSYGHSIAAPSGINESAVSFLPMQSLSEQGVGYAQSNTSFLPMVAASVSSFGVGYAQSMVSLSPMVVVSNPQSSSSVSFPAMRVLSADRPYGAVSVSFKPMTTASSFGELVPSYAVASSMFPPMLTAGLMLTGEIGGAVVSFLPMQTLAANKVYGASAVRFPAMFADSSAFEGNLNASIRELMFATTQVSFFGAIEVELLSTVGAESTFATLVLKNAGMAETLNVSGTMTYSAIMQAVIQTYVQSFAGIPVLTQDGEVWVVNDDSKASTSYESYGFNSFAKFNGKYYGAKSNGVFLLEGDTDAGQLVRSAISLGKQDFGASDLKTVPNCYIGVASSGDVYLKVIANDTSYLYKTVRSDSYLKTQRLSMGKGLRANYLTFELFNETGADFELSAIEFEVVMLTRRI